MGSKTCAWGLDGVPIPDVLLGNPYSFTEYDCQSIAMESDGECIIDVDIFYLGTEGNSDGITGFKYTTSAGNVGTVGQKVKPENRDQTLEEFNRFYNDLNVPLKTEE